MDQESKLNRSLYSIFPQVHKNFGRGSPDRILGETQNVIWLVKILLARLAGCSLAWPLCAHTMKGSKTRSPKSVNPKLTHLPRHYGRVGQDTVTFRNVSELYLTMRYWKRMINYQMGVIQ